MKIIKDEKLKEILRSFYHSDIDYTNALDYSIKLDENNDLLIVSQSIPIPFNRKKGSISKFSSSNLKGIIFQINKEYYDEVSD